MPDGPPALPRRDGDGQRAAYGADLAVEAQLAQEDKRKQQLEAAQATLKAKYQAAFDKAKAAYEARQYEEAVVNYRLASAAMQTAEVMAALKQAATNP